MVKNEHVCDCGIIHGEAVDHVIKKMLSEEHFTKAVTFYKALGDNTRFKIIWALESHDLCVSDIANILSMTKSAVSHQLAILRQADLIRAERSGKVVYYALADEHVRDVLRIVHSHIQE